jgi:hypothetical protein
VLVTERTQLPDWWLHLRGLAAVQEWGLRAAGGGGAGAAVSPQVMEAEHGGTWCALKRRVDWGVSSVAEDDVSAEVTGALLRILQCQQNVRLGGHCGSKTQVARTLGLSHLFARGYPRGYLPLLLFKLRDTVSMHGQLPQNTHSLATLPNPMLWHQVLHQYLLANTCNRNQCFYGSWAQVHVQKMPRTMRYGPLPHNFTTSDEPLQQGPAAEGPVVMQSWLCGTNVELAARLKL